MIRLTLLTLLITYLCIYSWRDWFKGALWLVFLMAIIEHPDMPKTIFGIPGFNLWNLLFFNVLISWLVNRKNNGFVWDYPSHLQHWLLFYFIIIFISVMRLLSDKSGWIDLNAFFPGFVVPSTLTSINEYLINCIKWVIPSLIIFDGCRKKKDVMLTIKVLLLMFVLIALQMIKTMKLGSLTIGGDELQIKAIKVLSSNVGFHRVNLSMMMAGAFWAMFSVKELVSSNKYLVIILPLCCTIFVALALTGGRAGYVSWAVIGIVLCSLRWRKYLLLVPVLAVGVVTIFPSSIDRLGQGLSEDNELVQFAEVEFDKEGAQYGELTSGRSLVWPVVLDAIAEKPWLGWGRGPTVNSTGIAQSILQLYGSTEVFTHPHNMYLQWLLDNGIFGAIPVLLFYFYIFKYALKLFKESEEPLCTAVGGICLSLLLALFIAGLSSQTFYPREGAVGLWVAMALMLRVHLERKKMKAGLLPDQFTE